MLRFLTNQLTGLVLLALSLVAFLIGIDRPEELVFDETHYVPAARAVLHLTNNTNPEHPLFAKEMIAAGIHLFGDNPFGWRFFSAVFAAFSIYAAFQIALRLFKSLPLAVLTALLILTSITVTVQARTAMLDSYAYPLLVMSAAFFIWSSDRRMPPIIVVPALVIGGALLGLAAGAKWIAGIYAGLTLLGLVLARLVAVMSKRRPVHHLLFGRDFTSWPDFSLVTVGLIFGLTSLIVYFLTFIPTLYWAQDPLSVSEVFSYQFFMLDRQTMPLAENSYESEWWEWPLMLEPIWYHFQDGPTGGHEAVFYVGNPVIFWGGLFALVFVIVQGLRRQNGVGVWIALAYLASWLIFAILPKQIGFLFYYHGSGILLCFVIPAAFYLLPKGRIRLGLTFVTGALSVAAFFYFLPVIYALEMPTDQWTRYLLMPSWR